MRGGELGRLATCGRYATATRRSGWAGGGESVPPARRRLIRAADRCRSHPERSPAPGGDRTSAPSHRGVYAVGHPGLSNEGRWMAGVLACGMGAVLSHRSAAELWSLLDADPGLVHVTTPTRGGRGRRRGLRIHRSPSLPMRARRSITASRSPPSLGPWPTSAARSRRAPAARGTPSGVSRALDRDRDRPHPQRRRTGLPSPLRRHRLPLPEVNVPIGLYTVDFLWRAQRLVVEIDGYAAHRGRQAFEDDRERELVLHARGIRVRRFSARQLQRDPAAVAASLRADGDFQSLCD